jgi:hypothetical protein
MCRLAVISNYSKQVYTCDQVRLLKDSWYKRFREESGSAQVEKMKGSDAAFEAYKQDIEKFLNQCPCDKPKYTYTPPPPFPDDKRVNGRHPDCPYKLQGNWVKKQ